MFNYIIVLGSHAFFDLHKCHQMTDVFESSNIYRQLLLTQEAMMLLGYQFSICVLFKACQALQYMQVVPGTAHRLLPPHPLVVFQSLSVVPSHMVGLTQNVIKSSLKLVVVVPLDLSLTAVKPRNTLNSFQTLLRHSPRLYDVVD